MSYDSLVQAFKTRQRFNGNLPKKCQGILNKMLYIWCPQDQWESLFETNCTKFPNQYGLKNQAARIKEFKSTRTFQYCPVDIRPKTPDIGRYGDKKMLQKAIDTWIEEVSRRVPRSMKPLHLIKDEDIKDFSQSNLFQQYQIARRDGLTDKISPDKTVAK